MILSGAGEHVGSVGDRRVVYLAWYGREAKHSERASWTCRLCVEREKESRLVRRGIEVFAVFEDKPFAVLVGDQGNHLIAQFGQESVANVSWVTIEDDVGIRPA